MKVDILGCVIPIKFFWIGYIFERHSEDITYGDYTVEDPMIPDKIVYTTIGFSQKSVLKRVNKKAVKLYKKYGRKQ